MMNVLEQVQREAENKNVYKDERIASCLYYISLSTALRALEGMDEQLKAKKEAENNWLTNKSSKIRQIPVLDMDNIKSASGSNGNSCDGLFYNFGAPENGQHYLLEMKNTGKKNLLSLMKSNGSDGILSKVTNSLNLIKTELEFGGPQEKEELINNMHFFIVYEGKNDIPVQSGSIKLPQKTKIQEKRGKQSKASKMDYCTQKNENDVYTIFGKSISGLGLKDCDEEDFPGDALPHTKKKGKKKIREFSIFSANDFAEIVEKGFFDNWNWGEYQKYWDLESERCESKL